MVKKVPFWQFFRNWLIATHLFSNSNRSWLCSMKPCSNIWFYVHTYLYLYLSLSFFLQKSLTIFHAALYGGAVITTGLDYFVEHSVMLMWVWDRVRVKESKPICWFSWAIVATWPLTFLLGIFIQIWLTYGGTYHEEQFPPLRRQKKHESREERKQRKYRYLYQVRTCHGDVISQPIANKYVTQIDESQA